MSARREVVRKLRAWEAGRPLPRYSTIHHAVMPQDQVMIISFVRMAGESRPWGIAWGLAGDEPTVRSVPDGRVRDDVGVLVAELAEDLLEHLRVHNWTFNPAPERPEPGELRQVWLPNGQHIAMLHQLSYTYSQTRFGGANQDILRALGRLAGWMFRDTTRIGNQHVVSASGLLGDAYSFPAQDARTAHLGYQLAWLTTDGDGDARGAAASEAEQLTVSPTLDPALDREELNDLVEQWQERRRDGTESAVQASEIAGLLAPELERRWRLTQTAYGLINNDARPVNIGVASLVGKAHNEFWFQHQRIELRHSDPTQGPAFVAHPETDFHGSSAASRYLMHAAADEAYVGFLVHDDPELFEEACDDGRAFLATVVDVWNAGDSKRTCPRWTLSIDPELPHRIREGSRLTPRGSPGHEATVLEMASDNEELRVTVEWTGRKTKALAEPLESKPVDDAWETLEVAFVMADAAGLTERRSQRVWKAKDGPGAWLTHGRPSAPLEISTDDGAVDLVVDDVAQIEEGTEA